MSKKVIFVRDKLAIADYKLTFFSELRNINVQLRFLKSQLQDKKVRIASYLENCDFITRSYEFIFHNSVKKKSEL